MASYKDGYRHEVVSFILKYGLPSSAILLTIFALLRSFRLKDIQRKFFASFSTRFTCPSIVEVLHPLKEELFSQLSDMTSGDPRLAVQGPGVLRILEIGVGSGVNLKYFPKGCRLVSVEPNPYFEDHFKRNSSDFPDILVESFIKGSAEDMSQVASSSIDVVVSTHVLCSVSSIGDCLSEVSRVLRVGGRFLYLEHVSFHPDTDPIWFRVQRLGQPFWSFFSDGCRLTTDYLEDIVNHHPPSLRSEKASVTLIKDGRMYRVMTPHVVGVSVKVAEIMQS